jgi:hypothetical protein
VVQIRRGEYELLGHERNLALKPSELPALVFTEGRPRTLAEIPGRTLELRLAKIGVNPWDDGLTNKTFQYYGDSGNGRPVAFTTPAPTNAYPASGDFQAAYAYAMALIARREFADADKHLANAAAVPAGTAGGEWEFEIAVTRAWAQALGGDFAKAKATLQQALGVEHECEEPPRARFLEHLFGIGEPAISPELQATLPARQP